MEQIRENPYLQYFLGFGSYQDEAPFDASMMVHFRKRFDLQLISRINETILKVSKDKSIKMSKKKKDDKNDDDKGDTPNKGKLIMDATCAPADIRFPTDLSLLNEARFKAEHIIDILYEPLRGKEKKVRTYRRNARKDFLSVAKKKRVTRREIKKALGKQLRYLRRDLAYIKMLSGNRSLTDILQPVVWFQLQ